MTPIKALSVKEIPALSVKEIPAFWQARRMLPLTSPTQPHLPAITNGV